MSRKAKKPAQRDVMAWGEQFEAMAHQSTVSYILRGAEVVEVVRVRAVKHESVAGAGMGRSGSVTLYYAKDGTLLAEGA